MSIKTRSVSDQGIVFPKGFRVAAVQAKVKKWEKEDVMLLVADEPCTSAGVFTRNRIPGEPVKWSKRIAKSGRGRVIVANSGISNVATGPDGAKDVRQMAAAAAKAAGVDAREVYVGSTGVIGVRLPMDRIREGIRAAGRELAATAGANAAAARAIMTTDTFPKSSTRKVAIDGRTIRLGAIAKGSGMIHPDMATMFCFVTTDLDVDADVLDCLLRDAVDPTLNMLSIDGETSTSDTTLILASGKAGNARLTGANTGARGKRRGDYEAFRKVLTELLEEMTRLLARDGEGATKLLTFTVGGARDIRSARAVARALSVSPLVKTAVFGHDPNPGRILQTIGRAGVPLKPGCIDVTIGPVAIIRDGVIQGDLLHQASEAMKVEEVDIKINLGQGESSATAFTCDYSYEYIRINAEYTT